MAILLSYFASLHSLVHLLMLSLDLTFSFSSFRLVQMYLIL